MGVLGGDVPVLAGELIRRLFCPDGDDVLQRLDEHLVAVDVERAEHFGVGRQVAGADAEQKPAFQHMVEHRRFGRRRSRMVMAQIDRAGAQLDVLGLIRDRGQEHHRVRHRLEGVGDVLAHIGFGKAQLVGEQERLAVLAQGLGKGSGFGMQRHGEIGEVHRVLLFLFLDAWHAQN